jgi:hypothetical protein
MPRRTRQNQVLGALVRIGARAGGDDPDAVLVALHLLSNGLYASAARLSAVIPEALEQLVAEAAGRIRAYPVDDRYTSYATQIVRNAEHALLAESYPQYLRRERVPVTPFDPCRLSLGAMACSLRRRRRLDVVSCRIPRKTPRTGDAWAASRTWWPAARM